MNVYEALSAVQSDIAVPKNRTNKFGGYSYRNAEDIMEAVKPACKKHGAAFFVSDSVEYIEGRFYIVATATFSAGGDIVQAKGYARECDSKKGMDEAQITGSASSYARKYALCGLFGIDGQDDPDAMDNRDHNPSPKREPKPEDALAAAKGRAWRAMKGYAAHEGIDANELAAKMEKQPGYGKNPEFFEKIAKTYEDALTNAVANNG